VTAPRLLVVDLAATSRNWSLPPEGEATIRAATPEGWEVRFVSAPTISDGDGAPGPSAEALALVRDAEAYFGFGMSQPLFSAARRLGWVQSAAAGVTALLYPEMRQSPVLLTNSAGVHAVPIAETVLGGVLHLVRSLDVAVEQQRRGVWNKEPFVGEASRVRELGECRALIVGTGGIGVAIAERLSTFGVRCTGVRRRPELGAPSGFARVVGPAALDAELAAADIVVLAAPLTNTTAGLLDAARLDRLPAEAIVVNVARGSLLDEAALAERVRAGQLRGAVLDVFSVEPLPADSPLWGIPAVLLTPHVSAVSPRRFWERELELFVENWQRYTAGAPLRNVVDKGAGY
jgi:phosphoglycerate dehydrogenase-like enzyme